MIKKNITALAMIFTLFGLAGFAVVQAFSITNFNLIGDADFKFHLVDMSGATEDQTLTLPTTVGNNGQVHIGKRIGTESAAGRIVPTSGDTVNGGLGNNFIDLGSQGDSVILLADEGNRTWWVVNFGNFSQ